MVKFADIRTNLDAHPITGDLLRLTDDDAIKNEIKNILFTNKYERPFDPEKGGSILRTLFDNFGADAEYLLETRIREVINKYITRARLRDVKVIHDGNNSYTATIVFTPINSIAPVTVTHIFQRVR